MLKTRSKSGMASLRYTMLTVICTILGLTGITQAYDYTYTLNNSKNVQIIDDFRRITTQGAVNWSNYTWSIDSIGNMTTTYNGDTSIGVYLPINDTYNQLNNTLSVFWNNNKLYYYSKNYMQGYFQYFCTGNINSNDFINCLSTSNGGLIDYTNYEDYILSGDLISIEEFNNNSIYHNNIVGFFYVDSNRQGNYNVGETPFGLIYDNNTFVAFPLISKNPIDQSVPNNGYNLSGTLGLSFTQPMSFANFQLMNTYKEEAPIVNGGGSNNTTNTPCITIGQLINMGGSDYNTGMCYTDSKYWSGNATTGEYIFITPQSIFTLYPTYTELREDMNIYNNYCNNYVATQQACITAFSGSKGLNITLLDKLKGKNSTRLNTLYDYCKTREVYSGSLETNTCDLTDEDIKNIVPSMLTPEGQAEYIMQQGITTTKTGEGTVYDGLVDNNQRDIITAIPRVIEKIETMFFNNSGVQGIIPDYITRIILLTVLFLIFKH